MLFNPGSDIPPAEAVFEAAYWEPAEDVPYQHDLATPSGKNVAIAKDMLKPLVRQIIKGEIRGTEAARGVVINPEDPELAATSVYNFPGTIFLFEREWLRDGPILLKGSDGVDINNHLALTPRQLIQRSNEDPTSLSPGSVVYSNDDSRLSYSREASIGIIVPLKGHRGGGKILEMSGCSVDPITGEVRTVRGNVLTSRLNLHAPFKVGVSEASYDENGSITGAERISSFELCAEGVAARVPLTKAVKRFVTGLVASR